MTLTTKGLLTGCLTGLLLSIVQLPSSARPLTINEATQIVGGDCDDKGCEDVNCANTGCTVTVTTCTATEEGTKCERANKNDYAKCGKKGSKNGFNCSDPVDKKCVKVKKGDQTADNKCPESQCKDVETCGADYLKCKATACE